MSGLKETIKIAFIKTIPVIAGYVVLGFGFGLMCEDNGFGVWWVLAMSGLIYAGSSQYVGVGLMTAGAGLITAALTTLMVNARHLFYGISMIAPYEKAGKYKPYLIFGLTDETYSLVCSGQAPEGIDFHRFSFWVTLLDQFYWVLGSVMGALAGSLLNINTAGVDFAMTALFMTVVVDQWKSTKNHLPALLGMGISAVCLLVFGPDRFLIPAMVGITLALSCSKDRLEAKEAA